MSWFTRLRNSVLPQRMDNDLLEEIRDHIDRRESDLRASGLSEYEARRQAVLAFGSVANVRAESRATKLWANCEGTIQDTRYAWRGLVRNPAFTITAVLSLGLAIGANAAIYALVDAVVLRPLPVPSPDRLFTLEVRGQTPSGSPTSSENAAFSFPLYTALNSAADGSARIALFGSPSRVDVQGSDAEAAPDAALQQFVSVTAFDVIGVAPEVGQFFSTAEDQATSPRAVVILSYDFWRRRYGADSAVVGKPLVFGGKRHEIIGVARAGFTGVEAGKYIDVWLPITLADPGLLAQPEARAFQLLGRLSHGITREYLSARLQPVFRQHQVERSATKTATEKRELITTSLEALPGANGLASFRRTWLLPLMTLLGIAVGVLLIACSNVASLLLARASARSSEIALRAALGAGRTRLVRQILLESVLVAVLATSLGWLTSRVLAPMLVSLTSSQGDPIRLNLSSDARVLLFCAGICALAAFMSGALPAWRATGVHQTSMRSYMYEHAGRLRLGRTVVGAQVAFAFCLVVWGAGFALSLRTLTSVDAGFDATGVVVMTVANDLGPQQRALQLSLMQQLQARSASLPGSQAAATAWMPMFSGGRRAERVVLPGRAPSARGETFYRVSPGFLATLHTPLLSGRDLLATDDDTEPVATIVNRTFAVRYFGTESAIGREFQRVDGARHRIVGISGDARFEDLKGGAEAIAYMPMKPPRWFTMYVRSTRDAASVAQMVQREARALGSGLRVTGVTTVSELVDSTMRRERLLAGIGGVFAFLGLVLAAIGLFGLFSYSVARRTKELGIRSALGAARMNLLRLIFKDEMVVIAGGLVAGLAVAFSFVRVVRSLLFGTQLADPAVIATALGVFVAAAMIACVIPALRATTIDPILALRRES
ncbi:MAG: ABC transporter permease [Gemmatimonadota bacterium]